jgi:nucleotide-binding universal stress UspA family protein
VVQYSNFSCMKTLLVPTDFSAYSEKALHLAMVIAKGLNAKIILQHIVQTPVVIAEVPYTLLQMEKESLTKEAELKMKILERSIEHAGGLKYESIITEGELASEILSCIQKKSIDIVLMGTKGLKNLESVVFGSTTDKLIKNAKCPVIAVPKELHFDKAIRKMTYATDYHKSDIKDILQLIEIASALKAQVNILHISGDEISADKEVQMMADFMQNINRKSSYNNMSFQILHGNKVLEKLLEYVKEGGTDLLVMATHHRSFFEQFYNKSLTHQMMGKITIPLVAFHYSAKD